MTILSISDFKNSKKTLHKMQKVHISQEHKLQVLKEDISGYKLGSTWLIKANQFDWIVNEYVSSKLYQWILGKDIISDTALIKDEESNKVLLGTALRAGYLTKFIPVDLNKKAGKVEILDCLSKKGCSVEVASKKIPVENIEKSIVVTRLLDDGDTDGFLNFAIVLSNDKAIMTRYDFDDSFKFLEVNVTSGIRKESLSQEVLSKVGGGVDQLISMVKSSYSQRPFTWDSLFKSLAGDYASLVRSHFKSNAKKFSAVFEEILNKDRSEIADIINKSLEEVGSVADEKLFKEYYNFKKLNKAGLYNDDNMLTREKLSNYLIDVINSNFDKLQVMHTCLQAEMAHKKKDQETLDNLYAKIDGANYECISPLSLKSFDLQDLFINSEL